MQTPQITLYIAERCGYCVLAKRLLDKKGARYQVVDLTHDAERRRWLVEASGQRTVPQVFVGDKALGGYTDLTRLDSEGTLDEELGVAGSD